MCPPRPAPHPRHRKQEEELGTEALLKSEPLEEDEEDYVEEDEEEVRAGFWEPTVGRGPGVFKNGKGLGALKDREGPRPLSGAARHGWRGLRGRGAGSGCLGGQTGMVPKPPAGRPEVL